MKALFNVRSCNFNLIVNYLFLQSAKHEEILGAELQSLKDQVNLKRSSMNEHVSHLESLREEVSYLEFDIYNVW